MSKEELEIAMRQALTKAGKTDRMEEVISTVTNLPFLQTDENRQTMFNQWADKL